MNSLLLELILPYFRQVCHHDNINIIASIKCIILSALGPPSIPINITILELGSRIIVLSWQDGISLITGNPPVNTYQVLLNNSLVITVSNTSVTLERLLPFTNYNVTIVAENRIGTSDSSEPVFFMTAEEGKAMIRVLQYTDYLLILQYGFDTG